MSSVPPNDDPASAEPCAGIPFDGRAYHYRQYSYDRVEDALNYARLERAKPGVPIEATAPLRWRQFAEPTHRERAQMAEYGIVYQAGRFVYGPYRYDVLADALSYAARHPGLRGLPS
ncbi:MAG: hypothetical protein ACXWC4_00220 [Telluria sp.]